ncbi:hypothetical protein SAMN06266787_10226 [Halorubrum ezzemoulense]|uniref:Uncharacterized protein n=1 Tax=Halorubrum ezzemoulense TaxID=337243 RepID=A0A238W8C3_HALEZ|nr:MULTISPECIES: hypothetical protein [Halorubrum]MDB2240573.1 hypothetical protein [Halorubrum ezzemoulense]TKX39618.1 hypothetical protein EXE52_09835 [Halorubrum sp. CGM4_25_10-8A]TKX64130.1 hypothetical protein EXE47_12145 [Halorubrum sp. GN12_10-3_MGM]SNR42800.1 hypothetical protein SAMN06266787_10226 [Halorubrum ezzemoulense]
MPSERGTPSTSEEAMDRTESAEVRADPHGDRSVSETVAEPDPIEWGPVRHERLRSLAIGVSVGIAGAVLVVFGTVAAGGIAGIASGDLAVPSVGAEAIAVGVALLLALLLGTVPVLYAVYRESSVGEPSVARLREAAETLRPGWTLAGLGAVVAAALALPTDFLPALWPVFWAVWFVPAVAESSGVAVRLDPAERAIARTYPARDRTRSDDLGAVVRTRRIDLPWTTVFLLAYRGNAWFRSTPWLFVPRDRADAVESALGAVLAESDGPDRASVPERLTLATLGSSSLVVGLLMAVAAGEGAGGLALALLTAPFSLLFLALAARL